MKTTSQIWSIAKRDAKDSRIDEGIINLENTTGIEIVMTEISNWFSGMYMQSRSRGRTIKIFQMISKLYPVPRFGNLYRLSSLEVGRKTTSEILKQTRWKTGPKEIQSWTVNEKIAESFYHYIYTAQRKTPSSAWAVVKATDHNLTPIASWESLLLFSYAVKLREHLILHHLKKSSKYFIASSTKDALRQLTSQVIHNQQEVICDVPGATANCKVVKILALRKDPGYEII